MTTFTLITGASTGIGKELSKLCASDGRNLVLVSRDHEKLHLLAENLVAKYRIQVEVLPKDLSTIDSANEIFDKVFSLDLEIDTLINNAGFGSLGAFHRSDLDNQLEMLRLNIVTLTQLTHYFLPAMIAKNSGKIMNIASTASFQPGPYMAVYYASKAFVLSFSEALSEELRETGVTSTALCPGPTRTEFQARAKLGKSNLMRLGMHDAHRVAEVGYRAMVNGKTLAVPGLLNRLLMQSLRISPRVLVRRVVHHLNIEH